MVDVEPVEVCDTPQVNVPPAVQAELVEPVIEKPAVVAALNPCISSVAITEHAESVDPITTTPVPVELRAKEAA